MTSPTSMTAVAWLTVAVLPATLACTTAAEVFAVHLLRPPAAPSRQVPGCLFDGQRAYAGPCVLWMGRDATQGTGVTISFRAPQRVTGMAAFTCDPNHLAWTQLATTFWHWDPTAAAWEHVAEVPDVTGQAHDPAFVQGIIETRWHGPARETRHVRITARGAGVWLSEVSVDTAARPAIAAGAFAETTPWTRVPVSRGTDVACGSSRFASVWVGPGNVADRLWIGHANHFDHRYRSLVSVTITPFLLPARVQRAVLVCRFGNVFGDADARVFAVEHFLAAKQTFGWSDLRSAHVEELGRLVAEHGHARHGNCYIDVTAAVNQDLAAGFACTSFRFRDVLAEREGNPRNRPQGAWLLPESMYLLVHEMPTAAP